jgi:hypothetical protein
MNDTRFYTIMVMLNAILSIVLNHPIASLGFLILAIVYGIFAIISFGK